jgi:outer membrane protein assembly factor BamB
MDITSKKPVILGVNRSVIAFDPETGRRLWERSLGSGWTNDFVSVSADLNRVYAHTNGRMFCLDLQTGAVLWTDELKGYGFGIGSIALPGSAPSPAPEMVARERQDDANSASATAATTS